MKRWWLTLVVAAALAAFACGGSKEKSDTPVNPDDVPVAVDGVAPDGADVPGVDTAPPRECETDADCIASKGETYACNCEFKCIEVAAAKDDGCREDKNCGSEGFCDDCLKTCRPLLPACEPCDTDRQCEGQMSHCVDTITVAGLTTTLEQKVCAPWCPLSTGACAVEGSVPGSYLCAILGDDAKNGVCVPQTLNCGTLPSRCTDDNQCGLKEKCWPDLKTCGCRDALSCDFGEACHPTTHRCVPGCTSDTECGSQKVCNAGLCQDACTGTLADGNIVGCTDPVPMEGKQWDCVDGHCSVPGMCFSPVDCREPEKYCDATSKTCVDGCLIDFDCKQAAKICDGTNKVCIDRGCDGNYQCSCGQICDLANRKCIVAEGKYCDVCDQQADDPCGDKATMCIGFKDPKTDEDKGSYCMPPCGPDKENPCPQGWQCQDVKDDKGVSQGKVCVRFCYQKVAGGCAMGDAPDPATGDATPGSDTATMSDP
jgi:hypothetical protein